MQFNFRWTAANAPARTELNLNCLFEWIYHLSEEHSPKIINFAFLQTKMGSIQSQTVQNEFFVQKI